MMRKRAFFGLLALTALLIAVAVWVRGGRAPETALERQRFIPALADRVNDVAKLEIKTKEQQVTLAKKGEGWAVENRGGYPADFQKVKATVVTLADMEVLEPKTTNRELYPRLGVEAVDAEGSTSKLLTLSDGQGNTLAALIAGKASSGRLSGSYVRPPNKAQALLVSGHLEVEADPVAWMDRALVDIPAERVSEVLIEVPGKPRLRIHKADRKGQDYALEALPAGAQLKSQITVNGLASALTDLRFDDVVSRAGFTLPEAHTITTVRTYDGLRAIVKSAVVQDRTHAVLELRYDPAGAEAPEPGKSSPPTTTEKGGAAAGNTERSPTAETGAAEEHKPSVAEEAAALNAKVADWVYVLPSYKGELLAKTMKDLLAEKEEAKPKKAR